MRRSQTQVRRQNLAIVTLLIATAAAVAWQVDARRGETARVEARAPGSAATSEPVASTGMDPAAATAATSTTAATPPRSFTLVATGDILGHNAVNEQAARYGAASGAAYDYRPMFERVRPILTAADLALCHLETPLTAPGGTPSTAGLVYSVPGELAAAIADAGYDGCSTASNHTVDRGSAGVAATLDRLDAAGLVHTGSARSAEGVGPAWYDVKGVRVAHLSYTYGLNGFTAEHDYTVNLIDSDRIVADARGAREAGAEFVVVSLHWGAEHRSTPTSEQVSVGDDVTASPDVDLVIGHHAHVVQPVGISNYKYVVYGLGNFLSNQHASECCPVESQDGVIVHLDVAETAAGSGAFAVTAVRAVPTWVDRSSFVIVPAGADLEASRDRTFEVLNRFGVTVTPLV